MESAISCPLCGNTSNSLIVANSEMDRAIDSKDLINSGKMPVYLCADGHVFMLRNEENVVARELPVITMHILNGEADTFDATLCGVWFTSPLTKEWDALSKQSQAREPLTEALKTIQRATYSIWSHLVGEPTR